MVKYLTRPMYYIGGELFLLQINRAVVYTIYTPHSYVNICLYAKSYQAENIYYTDHLCVYIDQDNIYIAKNIPDGRK